VAFYAIYLIFTHPIPGTKGSPSFVEVPHLFYRSFSIVSFTLKRFCTLTKLSLDLDSLCSLFASHLLRIAVLIKARANHKHTNPEIHHHLYRLLTSTIQTHIYTLSLKSYLICTLAESGICICNEEKHSMISRQPNFDGIGKYSDAYR